MDYAVIIPVALLLLGIIGYFVKRFIEHQDENAKSISNTHEKLSESINKLNISITGLNGVILSMQQGNDIFEEGCKERHCVVDTRLNAHSAKIEAQAIRITRLETKIEKNEN